MTDQDRIDLTFYKVTVINIADYVLLISHCHSITVWVIMQFSDYYYVFEFYTQTSVQFISSASVGYKLFIFYITCSLLISSIKVKPNLCP